LRKYVLPFLSFCLDYAWVNAAVVVADRLFPGVGEAVLGQPTTWAARQLVSVILVALVRLANASVGEWLLSYPLNEQPEGQRQWANLLLGTLGVLSGIWFMLRLAEGDDGTPFLFMVEQTPLKNAATALYGAVYGWCGAMLLRFAPRAKFYNALLLISVLLLSAINWMFSHDALVASMVARAARDGRIYPIERAEHYAGVGIYYAIGLIAVMLAILYFCRERPASQRAPASPA
jgi:hypothetical protein